jgi:PAS domain S-box-containing protein
VADASGNGFAVMDADGSLTYANRPLCRLLDEPEPEAVIGRPMIAYLPESWHATFQRDVLPAVLAEGSWVGEVPVRSRVGAVTPTMQAIFVVQRGPRQAMRIAARAIDISERRRLEETLRASEERYRELVETIDEVVFAVDAAGMLVYISSAVRQLLGHAPEDGLGQSVMRFVHPDDHAVIVERMRRRAEGEDLGPHEYRLLHADGSVRYARISTHPIRRDGRLVEFRGTMVDVHARRMAEEALRESESRYAALVEQAQVGVAIVQDGVIEYCNQYCAAMVGGTPQEFIGRPLLEFIAPEDRGAQDAIHRRRMRGDETAPLRYQALGRHRDGSTFRVENIATRILYRGRPAALVVIRYASEEG